MEKYDFDDLKFESKDQDIFNIPDVSTKLSTLQNYFFPRLEILLKESLREVREIYGVNPYEDMTFVYRPNHRKEAKKNIDFGNVFIGISGKRNQQKLIFKRKNGQYSKIHVSYLTYEIYPDGSLTVVFAPLAGYVHVDEKYDYIGLVAATLDKCIDKIQKIFYENGISYSLPHNFTYSNFVDAILNSPEEGEYLARDLLYFFSPSYYFPISNSRGLWEIKRAFVALYPILDSFITIAKGKPYPLEVMLDKLIEHYFEQGWYFSRRKQWKGQNELTIDSQENIAIPEIELESYRFVRAGLWWDVLARDQWTCCSCGRSSKEHGITLHVDHIIPRSRGGTDNKDNLQTLCWKCNIGKSNRDTTDLRKDSKQVDVYE